MDIATFREQSLPAASFAEKTKLSAYFTQAGLAVMALGIASNIPMQMMGRIFVGELVLIACAPIIVLLLFGLTNEYGRTARIILIALIVSWLGYLASDVVRHTPPSDYLRGWSKWIAMGASFATLAWLGSKNINLLISFIIGLAIGGCLTPFITGGFFGIKYYWKFHAGIPICILALIVTSSFRSSTTIITLLAVAGLSITLDSRSVALLCLATAVATWLAARRNNRRGRPQKAQKAMSKSSMIISSAFAVLVMIAGIFLIQRLGERYGYAERFERSNSARMASVVVAWSAIRDSPLIGHGSWPRDAELARERDRLISKAKGSHTYRSAAQDDLIIAHSQITQGWLEGGVLGLAFFVTLGWYLARQTLWLTFFAPIVPMASLIIFIQIHCAGHLVFSPFSGTQRVYIPVACAFICYVAQRRSEFLAMQHAAFRGFTAQRFPAVPAG
jgi:hypothetical protein